MCLKLRITSKISVTKLLPEEVSLKKGQPKKKQPSDFPIDKDSQSFLVHDNIKETQVKQQARQ